MKLVATVEFSDGHTCELRWSNGSQDWPGFSLGGSKRGYWYGGETMRTYVGQSKKVAIEHIKWAASAVYGSKVEIFE